jgi:hypothetical protein
MFGQDLSRKKIYPTAMKVNPPGTEIVRSDLFICLETVSLSLVSAQEGCLTSLRCLPSLRSGRQLLRSVRQLPSFSTTAESETVSRQIKSVLTSVLSLGFTFLGSRNIYDSCSILKYRQNRNQKRKIETHDTFLGGQIGSFEFFRLLQLKLK